MFSKIQIVKATFWTLSVVSFVNSTPAVKQYYRSINTPVVLQWSGIFNDETD